MYFKKILDIAAKDIWFNGKLYKRVPKERPILANILKFNNESILLKKFPKEF